MPQSLKNNILIIIKLQSVNKYQSVFINLINPSFFSKQDAYQEHAVAQYSGTADTES